MPLDIRANEEAGDGVTVEAVEHLVERATRSTFYDIPLTAVQLADNARIPVLGGLAFQEAARSPRHHLLAAFASGRLAGFMIAARHAPDDLEIDWLMVDPVHHGTGLADRLMTGGLDWLGGTAPIWLTVVRHNHRAIAFYRRHGFAIDESAALDRVVPSWIMRRPRAVLPDAIAAARSPAARRCA